MSYVEKLQSQETTVAIAKGVVGTLNREIPIDQIERIQLVSTIKMKDGTTAVHIVDGNAESLRAFSSINCIEVYDRFCNDFNTIVSHLTQEEAK